MMSDCVKAVDLYLASPKFESRSSSYVLVYKKLELRRLEN